MNRTETTGLKRVCVIAMAIGLLAGCALADSVRLKRGLVVDPREPVLLKQVADLEGAYAAALGETVVADRAEALLDGRGQGSVSLGDVRLILHRERAVLGRLAFSGSVCRLRSSAGVVAAEAEADRGPAEGPVWRTMGDWREATDATVEIAVVRRFVRELGVPAERLRLRFVDGSAELLAMPTGTRRTVIEPVSTMSSAMVLLRVERYAPSGSLELVETIKVEAQVLRSVLKLREQVSRREVIPGGVLEAHEEWLAPGVDAVDAADAFSVVGQIAQTRLEAGVILLRSQVEEPIAVERNALVEVIYHGGGFVLKTKARARQAGRRGEIIEVRVESSRSGFLARVDGPGRVVVVE